MSLLIRKLKNETVFFFIDESSCELVVDGEKQQKTADNNSSNHVMSKTVMVIFITI